MDSQIDYFANTSSQLTPITIAAEPNGDDGEPDSAVICKLVRTIAAAAYRAKTQHGGNSRPDASKEWGWLEAQNDRLRRQLEKLQQDHQLRLDQVLRWLTNLQRLIQAHGKP
jgi:hypothetical protein